MTHDEKTDGQHKSFMNEYFIQMPSLCQFLVPIGISYREKQNNSTSG